ncbi:ABC transporter ATP-binding protein [Nannocystis exedens]|uniref:ABC transporter ATP-binding protein n=1 Tax=Nannocystis exedens TaxID=54 RepID=UPI000BBA0977|nr:ABC transporter ATP-binding protein [Nannocystis exedens]PCC68582.1 Iron import ATP-binding/permease protein IrtB [Nannocystis exedens]
MIRRLLTIADSAAGPNPLRLNLIGLVVEAVLQGLGFVLLVPLLTALMHQRPDEAGPWLFALTGLVVVYGLVRYRTQLAAYHAAIRLARALFSLLGDQIARLPLGWFDGTRVGAVGRLTSKGVIDAMGIPAHLLRPVVNAFVTPSTVVVAMFWFDWRLALAALTSAPLLALTYRWTNARIARADVAHDAAAAEAGGRVVEFAQHQVVLRAFGRATAGAQTLDRALRDQRDASRRLLWVGLPGLVAFNLVVQAAFTVVLLLGTDLALGGTVDAAELVALLVLAVRFVEPLITAADLGAALRMAGNAVGRMDALLAERPLPEPAVSAPIADASVEVDRVGFAYADAPVLRDVSFTVAPGTVTALVGASGSGKTTLTRLIARFWDVGSGAVRVGGADVRDLRSEDLMARIALVFQDVYLFDGTILDNIRMGRPDADEAEVLAAARAARVDEIVARLPRGWDTRVGEGGSSLSGGERQRVSIARALLKDAPIVLLDEATAALDPENEAAVLDGLRTLASGRTVIVVAHRLATVVAADQIVVLDRGAVVEVGKHHDLVGRGGRYAAFWTERTRAQGWRLTRGSTKDRSFV